MNAGSLIGQYRLLRKIGAGGMGMVFVGEHVLLKRRAAIKTLLPSLSIHPEIVERFFHEARATSAISDPGIVQIFDFGYHVDGTAYIVMELLEGEALSSRIERLGTLPTSSALRIARQVASSLAAAHSRDIIHRDLKPENIFLIRDVEAQGGERTKILDFGICKVVGDGDPALTHTETMLGTPVYMSPEQCRGAGRADHRSDIYTLGCVLFHMLTGRAPFEYESVGELIAAHLCEQPPLASALLAGIPPAVDEVLQRCLAKAPIDRYPSMLDLQLAIEQVLVRLSAPDGLEAHAVAPAVALGDGFRSVYDGNLGGSGFAPVLVPEPDAPVPPMPSVICTPVTGARRRERGSLRTAALVIALLVAIGAVSIATRFTASDDAIAHPTPPAGAGAGAAPRPALASPIAPESPRSPGSPGSSGPPGSSGSPASRAAPEAPAAPGPTPVAARPPEPPALAPLIAPAPSVLPAADRAAPAAGIGLAPPNQARPLRPVPAKPRPVRSAPSIPQPAPPPAPLPEDLYDTR